MGRYTDKAAKQASSQWSRDWIILVLFAIFIAAIIVHLFYIQVIKGAEYSALAANSHTAKIDLTARRGTMYDRNGEVIASNIDATTIYVNPQEVKDPAKLAKILTEVLGESTGMTHEDFFSIVTKSDLSFAYIKRKADVTLANELKQRLEKEGIAGIHYLEDTKRVYPNESVGSQVIGVVNIDGEGIAGLEMKYDELLKGKDGKLAIERGANDLPISNGQSQREEATDGIDIVTSIDIKLQKRCEEALLAGIEEHEAQGGSVSVLDARTGEIYAACSIAKQKRTVTVTETVAVEAPEEARNAQGSQASSQSSSSSSSSSQASKSTQSTQSSQSSQAPQATEVIERKEEVEVYDLEAGKLSPITDVYEPGSTFKPFTAVSVFSNNSNINPDTCYTVPYALQVYDTVITDSHDHETEDMSITRILADSSNTGTTLMSREVERSQLYDTYNAFGMGTKPGCDFPGDAAGLVEKSEDWDGVQGATVTFGQGLSVTRMQILRGYATLEQHGVSRIPHFLVDVPNDAAKAKELKEPLLKEQSVADAKVCDQVSEMLTKVVTEGTGEAAAIDGFTVTGKTGTAEIASSQGGYEENAYIMSFCGWLYGSSSDLICLVTIDRPLTGQGGGEVCGPVFADIMSFAAERYQIDAHVE